MNLDGVSVEDFQWGRHPLLLTQTMVGVGTCCYTKQMMPLWSSHGLNNGSLKRVYHFFLYFPLFICLILGNHLVGLLMIVRGTKTLI